MPPSLSHTRVYASFSLPHPGICASHTPPGYMCLPYTTRVWCTLPTPGYGAPYQHPGMGEAYAPPGYGRGICTTRVCTTLGIHPAILYHPGYTLHTHYPARQRVYIPVPGTVAGERALGSEGRNSLGSEASELSGVQKCGPGYTSLRRVIPLSQVTTNG